MTMGDEGKLYEEGVIATGRTEGRVVWEDGQGFDDDVSWKDHRCSIWPGHACKGQKCISDSLAERTS